MDFRFTLLLLAVGCLAVHDANSLRVISRKTEAALSEDGSSRLGMYDGSKTTIQKHPYVASVLVKGGYYCEGTILSSSWVLTLGDCMSGKNKDVVNVVVGSQDSTSGTKYKVKKIVFHPQYNEQSYDYNYACLQVNGKFKWSSKVKPAKLPSKNPKKNTLMTVAGWGNTSPSHPSEDASNTALLQGQMTWLTGASLENCKTEFTNIGVTWSARMGCVAHYNGTTLCLGDFGDAFVKNGVFYGMFACGDYKGFCTANALPELIINTHSVRHWLKKITGAQFEDE